MAEVILKDTFPAQILLLQNIKQQVQCLITEIEGILRTIRTYTHFVSTRITHVIIRFEAGPFSGDPEEFPKGKIWETTQLRVPFGKSGSCEPLWICDVLVCSWIWLSMRIRIMEPPKHRVRWQRHRQCTLEMLLTGMDGTSPGIGKRL